MLLYFVELFVVRGRRRTFSLVVGLSAPRRPRRREKKNLKNEGQTEKRGAILARSLCIHSLLTSDSDHVRAPQWSPAVLSLLVTLLFFLSRRPFETPPPQTQHNSHTLITHTLARHIYRDQSSSMSAGLSSPSSCGSAGIASRLRSSSTLCRKISSLKFGSNRLPCLSLHALSSTAFSKHR